jgi:hypothetical protein
LADGGWVLGLICDIRMIEPLNIDRTIFCAKVLISADEPSQIYEGLGILKSLTESGDDSIILSVCTDKTIERLISLLSSFLHNKKVI